MRRSCGGQTQRRRDGLRVLLAACVLGAGMLLTSASAQALSQRGHVFAFSFGAPGSGEGQFSTPSGVAVDEARGDVYVADRANDRVQKFAPQLNSEGRLVGEEAVSKFKPRVFIPEAIAVDNTTQLTDPSRGDVYVVGSTRANAEKKKPPPDRVLYKFSAEGKRIATLENTRLKSILGLAVGANGAVFLYGEGATGPTVERLSDATENTIEARIESRAQRAPARGFAVDAEENFYVGHLGEGLFPVAAKLDREGGVLLEEIDAEPTTAVGVSLRNAPANEVSERDDVYLSSLDTVGGEAVSTLTAFGPSGSLIQRFGASGLSEGSGIAVDSQTGAVYVSDAAADDVDVFALEPPGLPRVDSVSSEALATPPNTTRLAAQVDPAGADTHAYFEFGPASCAAASAACARTSAKDLGGGFGDRSMSSNLYGLPPGAYHYRVVASNETGTFESSEQTFTIVAATAGLPDGRGWEMVSPPDKDGAEAEAITKEGGAIQAATDGSAITYVADGPMPAGEEPEGGRGPEPAQILSTRSSQGWVSRDISTPNSAAIGFVVGEAPEYRLFSAGLALALVQPSGGGGGSSPLAQPPLSPPLSPGEAQEKTIYLRSDAPIAPQQGTAGGETAEEGDYKLAGRNGEITHNPGYLALVSRVNSPGGAEFGGGSTEGLEFSGATPDLSHVVFASLKDAPGLYEWQGPEQPLQPVSMLPDGTRVNGGLGGPGGKDARNAISRDGSLVFWTSEQDHLYVRDTATGETLQLDAAQPGVEPKGPAEAVFQTASADGSKVFFTDSQRLTTDSHASEGAPDLYVFEAALGGTHVTGTLTDLTPQPHAGVLEGREGGGVLGASEDGSYVYFVANGALAAGATRGSCSPLGKPEPPGTTCNLYVRHHEGTGWGATNFIAALSFEDLPDWGGQGGGDLSLMTARVSPSGRYLAFMSDRSLTGYDNEDITSQHPGERLDEEVFLYDASSERLVCASCNPTGARPAGVLDVGPIGAGATGEGIGLVVDRQLIWATTRTSEGADHWLAGSVPGWTTLSAVPARALYQSRYLSDSGRLFFNSPDHLVPTSTGSKEKVYEYEPGGVGGCTSEGGCIALISAGAATAGAPEHESAFLDASESGNDVFFLTAAKLAPQDVDTNFDVYDAHVCEPSSPCVAPPAPPSLACDEAQRACKAPPSSTPAFTLPATLTFSGPGNIGGGTFGAKEVAKPKSPTRAQLLARALRACRNKYKAKSKRKKRAACEAQARKKYGPAKKAKKKGAR